MLASDLLLQGTLAAQLVLSTGGTVRGHEYAMLFTTSWMWSFTAAE